tara:strand:- start:240 stop:440 length:201 start_codon:yes stop_codon:yes gene_type:complete
MLSSKILSGQLQHLQHLGESADQGDVSGQQQDKAFLVYIGHDQTGGRTVGEDADAVGMCRKLSESV